MSNKANSKSKRICPNGHTFFKTSDCPVCPTCEELSKPNSGFLSQLSAPARRALEANGITTLQQLSRFSESELLKFHGLGKSSIPKLKGFLKESGLDFK